MNYVCLIVGAAITIDAPESVDYKLQWRARRKAVDVFNQYHRRKKDLRKSKKGTDSRGAWIFQSPSTAVPPEGRLGERLAGWPSTQYCDLSFA